VAPDRRPGADPTPTDPAAAPRTPLPPPLPRAETPATTLAQLLKVEADARRAASVAELRHLMANETRALVRARQVFVLEGRDRAHAFQVRTVSSLATVDREVPLVRWMERLLAGVSRGDGLGAPREWVLPGPGVADDTIAASYPFPNLLWVPLWCRDGRVRDGLLLARDGAWLESDRRIAMRLAETFGHALELARRPGRVRGASGVVRALPWLALPLALVAGAIPVPITALAPLEVVPRDPAVVAMPVDGVVQAVLVEPNATVAPGTPLVRLVDTVARNRHEVATREVAVAEARVERASSLGFSDPKGRHEIGIARAELALKIAERAYARELLAQQQVTATAAGIAVFSDRKDMEGKPLATGDRLMQIARPGEVELRIDLAAADSIVMQPGARVKAFLDSDPLAARVATVVRIDYQPRVTETGVAAYRIVAALDGAPDTADGAEPAPRLGTRGTAQLYGPTGPLALYLFRRPLAALRQWAGL
jgi:hypothetical protein